MSLEQRAKAAAEADRQAQAAKQAALIVERRTNATQAILKLAESFGIDLTPDAVRATRDRRWPDRESPENIYSQYEALVPINEDATLVFRWLAHSGQTEGRTIALVRASNQLYYNVDPRTGEIRPKSGGGIHDSSDQEVKDLAAVGIALERLEKSRQRYEKYWQGIIAAEGHPTTTQGETHE